MPSLLMVQCNRLVAGVQYPGISSISAFLKRAGHELHLFDCAEYTPEVTTHRDVSEKQGKLQDHFLPLLHKRVTNGHATIPRKPLENLLDDLKETISTLQPDFIGFSSFSDEWPFTIFLIQTIKRTFQDARILVGGVHPTISPDSVIKFKEVLGICVSDGELPLVQLLNAFSEGRLETNIPNMWFRGEDGTVIKNKVASNSTVFNSGTPFLDWDIYNDHHFLFPFEGKMHRRGSVALSRGCPYSCSYCVNDLYRTQFGREGNGVIRKSVDYAIREITYLKNKYNLSFLRFWDETFLAMPWAYLEEFCQKYMEEINLPFTIETTANTINEKKVRILKKIGCVSISLGVETVNEEKRQGLLNKKIPNSRFESAFRVLHELDMRYIANFMFFLPEQTIEEMYQSIVFCQENHIKYPSPRIFFPYPGSWLRSYGEQNDLFDVKALQAIEDESQITSLEDLSGDWVTANSTVLKVDSSKFVMGKRLLDNFILLMETPLWLHGALLKIIEQSHPHQSEQILEITKAVYTKRFPDTPGEATQARHVQG